jgi:hypothetical protein
LTPKKSSCTAATVVALFLGLHLTASSAAAERAAHPFQPGETLTYKLRWKFINAGSAVFTVLPMAELGQVPAYHFVLTVRSSPLLDLFYRVRDRVESYADSGMTRSLLYKNEQREGDYSRDVVVTFDWENETARFQNRGERLDPILVPPGTFDPLSISYYLRLQELVPGRELMAPVTDGKRCVIGRVRVVEKQEVNVPAGRFEALLVEPVVGHLGGVFKRSETASVQIWISSDPRHIPVKVSGNAKLGSFSAVLVSVESTSR